MNDEMMKMNIVLLYSEKTAQLKLGGEQPLPRLAREPRLAALQ